MSGYFLLLLLVSARTRVWIAVLFSALFVPALVTIYSPRARAVSDIASSAVSPTILLLGAAWGVNLLALAVHQERARSRSRLLRIARIDGWRAVEPLCLAGMLTVATVSLVGYLSAGLVALQRGGDLGPWLRSGVSATLSLTPIISVGVVGGYLLPRTIALVVVNLVAFGVVVLVAPVVYACGWSGSLFSTPLLVAAVQVLTLPLITVLWRKTSAKLW